MKHIQLVIVVGCSFDWRAASP